MLSVASFFCNSHQRSIVPLVILSPVSGHHDTECKQRDGSSTTSCENLLEEVNHLSLLFGLALHQGVSFASNSPLLFLISLIKFLPLLRCAGDLKAPWEVHVA